MQTGFRQDAAAADFAQSMLSAGDTMQTVLAETVDAAQQGQITESGRTACGSANNIKGPLGRFPRSVTLQECPRNMGGTWHTHVTLDQLLNPEHSLPDMANVALHNLDVSVVVGSETSDVFVAPQDPEAMKAEFQQILGMEVRSTRDVSRAIKAGKIHDPASMRARMRQAFAPLFERRLTGYSHLSTVIQDLHTNALLSASPYAAFGDLESGGFNGLEPLYAADLVHEGHGGTPFPQHMYPDGDASAPEQMRMQARRCNHGVSEQITDAVSGMNITELALATAIGDLTSMGLQWALRKGFY